MNAVPITNLNSGSYSTEDIFIFENLFFYPKNLPVSESHINILKNWNVENVFTNGNLLKAEKDEIPKEGANKLLEDLFDNDENESPEKAPENVNKAGEKSKINSSNPEVKSSVKSESIVTNVNEPFKDAYKKWILMTVNFFNDIVSKKTLDKEKVLGLLKEIKQTISFNKNDALMMFGRPIEGISYIYTKTIETTILSFILAESMNLVDYAVSNLAIATLFHDLGMIKIPKPILQKTGPLTKEELTVVQNHTIIGFKYLKEINYSVIIASGSLQHHERVDGKGYPNRVSADKITEIAKIIAVVDAYCSAIADKPFKDPLHAKDAVQDLLKSGGTAYDPAILRELVKNISFYPVGSLIRLSNGIPAKVIGTSGVAMRPIVRTIILNSSGATEGEIIDLSKRNDLYIKGVFKK
ncbi:MAG TPA: HD domain-containing protein [Spirochaetota bacterium]|nr:HD domain-containing protein [Spirochaetota bacterium]HOS31902.1 HD domain-containing protein [Spirochaetota bacterium]HOS54489.1 HD domain-containing protein [Spirochaetota bacterium]HQF76982.1 HD domain-containing protein [Spirochaetota bacterium]HQH29862.1 HD domain-containing protein [Spirochaetota bacterium]